MSLPTNVSVRRVGTKIVIEVDASREKIEAAPFSSTGKTRLLASSAGTMPVEGMPGVSVAVNVMLPRDVDHLLKAKART